jgi:hypothetical protein
MQGSRFTQICRVPDNSWQVGDRDVDLHLEGILDLVLGELAGPVRAVEDDHSAVHLQRPVRQSKQAQRVADRQQRRLQHKNAR